MIDIMDVLKKINFKIVLQKPIETINIILKCFFFYLAFVGIFGFSLFLAEEQSQILVWSGFPSQDTGRYDLLRENCEMIKATNDTAKVINKWVMWLMPPQKWAYGEYHKSMDQYIKNINALILANDPEVYLNEHVSIQFKYNTFKPAKNGLWIAQSNKVKVILKAPPATRVIAVAGIIKSDPEKKGGVIIEAE